MGSALTQALCQFHGLVKTIHKDGQAQYGKYATLQAVLAAVTPALCESGLVVTQQATPSGTLLTVLRHVSGERIESEVPLVIGASKNALHGWGGAITYQRRYMLLAILGLAAGIEDDDGASAGGARLQQQSATNDDFF
jgi:hypothetical protein